MDLQLVGRSFYKNRFLASGIGSVSEFIGFFLLQEIGIILTVLIGFLSVGTELLFSYLMLGDVPSRKNLFMAFLIVSLVGLGFYLK